MSAKVCPRCGVLFESLKSTTCPQCFAILDTVDDQSAQELSAEKAKEESSEEFQAAKEHDDEHWAEQSFNSCLAVVAIAVLTVVVSVIIVVTAVHRIRYSGHISAGTQSALVQPIVQTRGLSSAALPNEILPASVGAYYRTALDTDLIVPGATDIIVHGCYNLPGESGVSNSDRSFDVFVIRQTSLETNGEAFSLGCAMAAHVGASDRSVRPMSEAHTPNWTYAVIGDNKPDGALKARALVIALISTSGN